MVLCHLHMVGGAAVFRVLAQAWPPLLSGSGIPWYPPMGLTLAYHPKLCIRSVKKACRPLPSTSVDRKARESEPIDKEEHGVNGRPTFNGDLSEERRSGSYDKKKNV